jgi:hypothetical protein
MRRKRLARRMVSSNRPVLVAGLAKNRALFKRQWLEFAERT